MLARNFLFFFSFLCSTIIYGQNINYLFPSSFDKTGMETDILYNPANISNINSYSNKTHNIYSFYQAYKAIAFSDFQQRLPNLQNLKDTATSELLSSNVSLALLFTEYDSFNEEARINELIVKNNSDIFERIESDIDIFNHHRLLIGAALKPLQRGSQATYILSSETLFNTTEKNITKIEIDFGDNQGYQLIVPDTSYNVSYNSEGEKILKFKITLDNIEIQESTASIKIIYSNQELNEKNNQEIIGFTSGTTDPPYIQPYNEFPFKGWGEMDIFYSSDNILDKPIFLIDGFDPLDSRNINALYSSLNFDGGNLGDIVRENGYDVVVLNFPTYFREEDQVWIYGGADYIERNAMLLVELIKYVNNLKVGNKKNVVIGPSMGGLIARYALNYMESIDVDHETRLYISFDAPHAGANVPIGFQHMFNYLAYGLDTWVGDFSIEALRPIVDRMLKSPAARQMLWDHFEPHLSDGNAEFNNNNALPQPHPFFNIFYNAIDTIYNFEYPQNTRNVTILNGSGSVSPFNDTNGNPVNPGAHILDGELPNVADGTNAYLDVWYTPYINQAIPVSEIFIDAPWICFCDITAQAIAQSHGHTDGIDTSPGGLFDINSIAAEYTGTDELVNNFINQIQTNYFTFVPSISSMDYFTNNWYEYMNNPDNPPFDAWSMPDENEIHTQLTDTNVEFALNEIFNGEEVGLISDDADKKPGMVHVEDGGENTQAGRLYRVGNGIDYATRGGNGNENDRFGNIGDWSFDVVITEKTPQVLAESTTHTESGHPIYTGGDGNWSQLSEGMGAIGWGSFAANAYNRASGKGSVAMGFANIAGPQVGTYNDDNQSGSAVFGYSSRALGPVSFASGYRNTASAYATTAMGNYNYATGDASSAIGKENWAEGANTTAIGYKNHAAGDGSNALGQENIAWGTTNFTSGYQNVAGDMSSGVGTGGSATAMGKYNVASADASMALNRGTQATNKASTSMGFRTISDNLGMLAIGVNNAAGLGDTGADSYYYADGEYTGVAAGVAFVIGNGDINTQAYQRGDNPSNAFIVNYDGTATLAGDLTINSDARLKSNIISLGSTLSKLLLIDGKSYTMKANESIEKIGLLAQEVQQAFPELVKVAEDKEGTLSVNYQGMIPVLINAIKEQQKQIDELKAIINQ